MITNERQYLITKRQLKKLRTVLRDFNLKEVVERVGSEILAAAEMNALKSEEVSLADQLKEYELLRTGKITTLKASSLGELPNILIRARIAHGLSQRDLAELAGLKEQQIQRYEAAEYASANLRRLSEIAEALKLNITEIAELKTKPSTTATVSAGGLEWSKFPVKEMYRRQWFEDFSGSWSEALEVADTLVGDFVKSVIRRPAIALHRKQVRAGSIVDDYALLAWECRILYLARKAELGRRYEAGSIDAQWIAELAKESRKDNGPLCAKGKLAEAGIALVVERHLANTHLDGAALLHDKGPVIGLTLRYDRLDNFWFVLFHELFHIIKHLRRSKLEGIFDDFDSISTDRLTIRLEDEANSLAGEALIPEEVWDCALARYVRTPEAVIEMAEKIGVSPAIVAGRIRHEATNYIILNDLVGQGEVRKNFPEAGFGR
ncbi:MAG: XRE family transcriptional regulator [Dehalococcoidia bacterium]